MPDYHKLGHESWAVGRNIQAMEELRSLGLRTGQVDLTNSPCPFVLPSPRPVTTSVQVLPAKKTEIHFPKRFTYMLKFFSYLPRPI